MCTDILCVMKKRRPEGRCRLSGQTGPYVASHIIPKSLTKPSTPGQPFIQAGKGTRPVRRFDSWYDPALVIREGEDILAAIDGRGVELLRRHRLVWSGWGEEKELPDELLTDEDSGVGLRFVPSVDLTTLRIFLLSILWRAAESNREEFKEIALCQTHRDRLRQMILAGDPQPLDWYSTILTQVRTRGPNHNHAPLAMEMPVRDEAGNETGTLPSFRFYFDGLVVHFMRPTSADIPIRMEPAPLTTIEGDLAVVVVRAEDSYQMRNLNQAIAEAEVEWPEEIDVLSSQGKEGPMPGYPDIAAGDGLVMMHDLIEALHADVHMAYETLESDRNSQFLRRSAARAVFAYVEALLEAIRTEVRSTLRLDMFKGELTKKEEEALGFRHVVGVPGKLLALEVAVKRVFKLAAKVWFLDFQLDAGGDNYRDFIVAKMGRNKLTHPRTAYDIQVTDEDMHYYTVAGLWVQTETQRLFKARQEAIIAMMSPEARASFLETRSGTAESGEQSKG